MQAPNVTLQSSSPVGQDAGKPELTNKITGSANQIQNLSPSNPVSANVPPPANSNNSSSSNSSAAPSATNIPDGAKSTSTPISSAGQTSATIITVSDKSLIATNNLQPVQVITPEPGATPSQTVNVAIANQQYQLNLSAELQKLLQTTSKLMITADAVKAINLQKISLETGLAPSTPTVSQPKAIIGQNPQIQGQLVLLAQSALKLSGSY